MKLEEVNDNIIGRPKQQKKTSDDNTDDKGSGGSAGDNEGILIPDATCAL